MLKNGSNLFSLWQNLPHSWETDPREPSFSFEVGVETWNFYSMSVSIWAELLLLLILEAFLTALLSRFVYRLIVQQQGTMLSYLVCYGFFLPFWTFAPFYVFSALQIRHELFRFCLGAITPVTAMLRTTAAVHGFTPDYAKISEGDFALYFACPMTMLRDPKLNKFVKTTSSNLLKHLGGYFVMLLFTSILQSLFWFVPGIVPEMGQGNLAEGAEWYSPKALLQPRQWFQNILIALFYQTYISCFGEGLILAQSALTGLQTHPIMDNPCMTARSFSDFWGRRWNLVIHEVLKCGVYLPVRKHFPKYIAMLSTFLVSGLFHEWLLWVFTFQLDDKHGCYSNEESKGTVHCYQPSFGATNLFFVWQAILMSLEFSPLGKLSIWKYLPDAVATILILITGGLVAHWFAEPYINSRYFIDGQMMLFVLKPSRY